MDEVDRRHLIGGLAVAGGALAAHAASAAAEGNAIDMASIKKDTDVACVYHCDFGDPGRIGQMATNINNHLSVYGYDPFKAKIVVVAHGQGIKPFLTDLDGTPWAKDTMPPALFTRFEDLAKLGVEVYLCQITFKNNKIDIAKARKASFIKLVPSGVATVAALQGKGFAYVKVG